MFADPAEVIDLLRHEFFEDASEQVIVLFQRIDDGAGRQVHFGQTAAVVFHLLEEFADGAAFAKRAERGAGRDGAESGGLPVVERGELILAGMQRFKETLFQLRGTRPETLGELLQLFPELIAQHIGCCREDRRCCRSCHSLYSSAVREGFFSFL